MPLQFLDSFIFFLIRFMMFKGKSIYFIYLQTYQKVNTMSLFIPDDTIYSAKKKLLHKCNYRN